MKTLTHTLLIGSFLSFGSTAFADLNNELGGLKGTPGFSLKKIKKVNKPSMSDLQKRFAEANPGQSKREAEIRANGGKLEESEKPKTALFQHSDIKKGRNLIAGSVQLIKVGAQTRIAFTTFKDHQTFYNKFGNATLEKELYAKLKDGAIYPVMMTGHFAQTSVNVGRKSSTILVLDYVYSCEIVSVESICQAAEKNGFTQKESDSFTAHVSNK